MAFRIAFEQHPGATSKRTFRGSNSLLKNLEMENFHISADRFWSGAVELDVIS
ncbi:hypothetical protein ABIA96_007381, partial [Bradyrhizobium sp. LB11.1]